MKYKGIKKLKAFTIIELVIVLMISALVIAICYKCLDIIQREYSGFMYKNSRDSEATLFKHVLYYDLDRAKHIFQKENGIVCINDEGNDTKYIFDDTYVLRIKENTDTFHIAVHPVQLKTIDGIPGLLKSWSIEVDNGWQSSVFTYEKKYAVKELIVLD